MNISVQTLVWEKEQNIPVVKPKQWVWVFVSELMCSSLLVRFKSSKPGTILYKVKG